MNHHSLIKHGNEKTSSLISGWWDDYSQHLEKKIQTTNQILFSDQHLHLQDLFQLAMELMTWRLGQRFLSRLRCRLLHHRCLLHLLMQPKPKSFVGNQYFQLFVFPQPYSAFSLQGTAGKNNVFFTVKINHGEFRMFEGFILMFNGQLVTSTCVNDTSTCPYII